MTNVLTEIMMDDVITEIMKIDIEIINNMRYLCEQDWNFKFTIARERSIDDVKTRLQYIIDDIYKIKAFNHCNNCMDAMEDRISSVNDIIQSYKSSGMEVEL